MNLEIYSLQLNPCYQIEEAVLDLIARNCYDLNSKKVFFISKENYVLLVRALGSKVVFYEGTISDKVLAGVHIVLNNIEVVFSADNNLIEYEVTYVVEHTKRKILTSQEYIDLVSKKE